MKKRVIFTGGGSGGHVVPALTLISKLSDQYEIVYIGSKDGIESRLVTEKGINYLSIPTGKLRRYLSFKNLVDIFKVTLGVIKSFLILFKFRGDKNLVVSTGGFVSVPVVVAAKGLGIKIFIHEQTSCVGLANKISSEFADKVFISFENSKKFFPSERTFYSGYPVRDECYDNKKSLPEFIEGVDFSKIDKPLLLITGGGNGSALLNRIYEKNMNELTDRFFVFHQVGQKFIDEYRKYESTDYHPVAFIGEGMIDLFKKASLVISRSGAGTVCELIALKKPSIFIPLKIAQKNEQFHNAVEAKKLLGSYIVEEDYLPDTNMIKLIDKFLNESFEIKNVEEQFNSSSFLTSEIEKVLND